jgi:hypothetical protein
MSGLLDKAKGVAKGEVVEGVVNVVGTPEEPELSKESSSGLLQKATRVDVGGASSAAKKVAGKPRGAIAAETGGVIPPTALTAIIFSTPFSLSA